MFRFKKNLLLIFLVACSQNHCSFYEKISAKKWHCGIGAAAVICTILGFLYWYKNHQFFKQFSPQIQPIIREWLKNSKSDPGQTHLKDWKSYNFQKVFFIERCA